MFINSARGDAMLLNQLDVSDLRGIRKIIFREGEKGMKRKQTQFPGFQITKLGKGNESYGADRADEGKVSHEDCKGLKRETGQQVACPPEPRASA
jgi:hypothetical protein